MAEKTLKTRIINKHDTEENWNKATSFVPKAGEVIIYEADSTYSYPRIKVGDGTTAVTALPFSTDGLVTLSTEQTISGKKIFNGGVQFGANTVFNNNGIQIPAANAFKVMGMYDVSLPSKTGTLALTSDIPSGGGSGGCILDDLETGYKEGIANEDIENVNAVPVLDVEGMGNWTMVPVSELGGAKYLHHLYITGGDERAGNFAICAMHVNNSNTPINTFTQLLSELALRRMMATGYCGSTNSTHPVYCLQQSPNHNYIRIYTVTSSGDSPNDIGSNAINNGGIIDSVLPI